MTVSLKKGEVVNLEKDIVEGIINVGVNWGAIETKTGGFLGFGKKTTFEAVDLDVSCVVFDNAGNVLETVYFGNKIGKGIKHSGDDITGDIGVDDGEDNETISVDLKNVDPTAKQIVFILNSFRGHKFGLISFASIRLYVNPKNSIAEFNIANDEAFANTESMVLAKIVKDFGKWSFKVYGEPIPEKGLVNTRQAVINRYL